jgi:hypothetical protein
VLRSQSCERISAAETAASSGRCLLGTPVLCLSSHSSIAAATCCASRPWQLDPHHSSPAAPRGAGPRHGSWRGGGLTRSPRAVVWCRAVHLPRALGGPRGHHLQHGVRRPGAGVRHHLQGDLQQVRRPLPLSAAGPVVVAAVRRCGWVGASAVEKQVVQASLVTAVAFADSLRASFKAEVCLLRHGRTPTVAACAHCQHAPAASCNSCATGRVRVARLCKRPRSTSAAPNRLQQHPRSSPPSPLWPPGSVTGSMKGVTGAVFCRIADDTAP